MPRNEMLAAYFVHDDEGWRLKVTPLIRCSHGWQRGRPRPAARLTLAATTALPSSAAGDHPITVPVEIDQDGQLFATDLGGVGGRAQVRRSTLAAAWRRQRRSCRYAVSGSHGAD